MNKNYLNAFTAFESRRKTRIETIQTNMIFH